jgi:hypothetical protein
MTRNVTLRMDDELLTELQHRAVDAHMSLSAWLTTMIRSMVPPASDVDDARERAIRRMDSGFHLGGTPLSREELHVR